MTKIKSMKKIVFLFLLFTCSITFSNSELPFYEVSSEIDTKTEFCKGWEEGYCEGWKDVKGQFSICPVTPICPIPPIGKDNYKGGYNEGFKAGMKKARKS